MLSIRDITERVATQGPLSSDSVRRDMAAVLGRVPYDAVSRIGFESRLGGTDGRVDFFLGFGAADAQGLRRTASSLATHSSPAEATVLKGLYHFASCWERSERLSADVRYLWLEYDGGAEGTGRPPGIFLGSAPVVPADRDPSAWVAERCGDIREMSGNEVPESIIREVDRCIDACPPHVDLATIGFFLGRPHAGLRLCFGGFDLWGAGKYLERIGYEGDVERFIAEVIDVRAGARGILEEIGLLHIDVGSGRIGSRVGVELVFEVNRQVNRHLLDTDVLDALVRKNLADPDKCRWLAAWPGAQRWEDGSSTLYIRRVNHLKLVFVRDHLVEAKAYFGIRRGLPEFVPAASVGLFDGEGE